MAARILNAIFLSALSALIMVVPGGYAVAQETQSSPGTQESNQSTTTVTAESTMTPIRAAGRPKIVVWTFENPADYHDSTIGDGLTAIIITHLAESGRFEVIQRGESLEEVELGQSGYIEPDAAVEMGRALGVDYILAGQVTNFGYEESSAGGFLGDSEGVDVAISRQRADVRLDFSVIDTVTGATVLAASAEGEESETGVYISGADWPDWIGSIEFGSDEFAESMIGHATLKAVENLMDQLFGYFPIQAPLLAVTEDFVVIGIGANAHIEKDMEFEVYRLGAVTDSNGEVVWKDRTLLGRVRVTEVDITSCKAVWVTGGGFMEGDLCVLPE